MDERATVPEATPEAAAYLEAMGDLTRLRLLGHLLRGPALVGELVAATGLKQGHVSKHLGILHRAGLVERAREGVCVRYAVAGGLVGEIYRRVAEHVAAETRARFERMAGALGTSVDAPVGRTAGPAFGSSETEVPPARVDVIDRMVL